MATNAIKINTVIAVVLVFIAGDSLAYLASKQLSVDPLVITGITRLIQILVLIWLIIKFERRLSSIGWSPGHWRLGLLKGAFWSISFAVVAGFMMAIAYWYGYNPILFFRADMSAYNLPTFFIVGGLIAPIFEELCFRGVIYNYMRQIGFKIVAFFFQHYKDRKKFHSLEAVAAVIFAVICSTIIFAMLHFVHGLPITQIVGGIVFAIAYETSRNLMVPITIHVTGNLAIFSLSLL